jgi:site-specific recombinase XerD
MKSDHHTSSWLFESPLAPFVDAFMLHLFDCRYASNTIDNYLAGLTHFAHWLTESHIDVKTIDERLIQLFWMSICQAVAASNRHSLMLKICMRHWDIYWHSYETMPSSPIPR